MNSHHPTITSPTVQLIKAKPENSQKAQDTFEDKRYQEDINNNGQPKFYRLKINDNGSYVLVCNITGKETTPLCGVKYSYVFLPDEKEPRIKRGGHYFAAGKAEAVKLAGDVVFKKQVINGKERIIIDYIDDYSGAYPSLSDNMTPETKKRYKSFATLLIKTLGAEENQFKMYTREKKEPTEKAVITENVPVIDKEAISIKNTSVIEKAAIVTNDKSIEQENKAPQPEPSCCSKVFGFFTQLPAKQKAALAVGVASVGFTIANTYFSMQNK